MTPKAPNLNGNLTCIFEYQMYYICMRVGLPEEQGSRGSGGGGTQPQSKSWVHTALYKGKLPGDIEPTVSVSMATGEVQENSKVQHSWRKERRTSMSKGWCWCALLGFIYVSVRPGRVQDINYKVCEFIFIHRRWLSGVMLTHFIKLPDTQFEVETNMKINKPI